MKGIKGYFGIVAVIFLFVSSMTLVPQTQSEPIMGKINELEEHRSHIDQVLSDTLGIGSDSLIDWIIEIITSLINIFTKIQLVVGLITGIISSVQRLLTEIPALIAMITAFISLLLAGPQTAKIMG